jgi:hypothetical protein
MFTIEFELVRIASEMGDRILEKLLFQSEYYQCYDVLTNNQPLEGIESDIIVNVAVCLEDNIEGEYA